MSDFDRAAFESIITDIQTGLKNANTKAMGTMFTQSSLAEPLVPKMTPFTVGGSDDEQTRRIPNYLLQSVNMLKLDTVVLQWNNLTITMSCDKMFMESYCSTGTLSGDTR